MKEKHDWDFVVCITDLPSISGNKVVISDFNNDKQVAMLSLPSLGWIDLRRKLRNSLTSIIEQLYYSTSRVAPKIHPLIHPKAVEPNEDETPKQRYIHRWFILSWIQLILGLTRANEPWKNIFNFKRLFQLLLQLGLMYRFSPCLGAEYTVLHNRFIILMLIAILGMTGWLLYAHQLIERKTAKSQRVYRYIYNFTTVFTLFIITLLNYIILYLLLAISVSLFVPPSLFNQWTSAHPHFTL